MEKYLTRKKLATSETATSDEVTDSVDTPDTVDPAAQDQSQNDSEVDEEITSDDNPWPYISPFFKFQHSSGKNRVFICNNCPSSNHTISTSAQSNNNLRRYLTRKHKNLLGQFDQLVNENAYKKKEGKRKRETSTSAGPSKRIQNDQPCVDTFMAASATRRGKVPQKLYEDKVRLVVEFWIKKNMDKKCLYCLKISNMCTYFP